MGRKLRGDKPKLLTLQARRSRRKSARSFDHCRLIMSSQALESFINTTSNHAKVCKGSHIKIKGCHNSNISARCTACKKEFMFRKDSPCHEIAISDAIAAGALCAGVGYSSIKTIFSSLQIPFIAKKTYENAESRVGIAITKALQEQMIQNGKEERELAIQAGDIFEFENVVYGRTSATVDGGWGKRSFGHSYNSNAGVAVIIGSRTKKILHMDYRITSCCMCDKYKDAEEEVPDHICYRNWSDSAQAMESDIILDGFQKSMEDHKLIYEFLIGDADSSVFSKVQTNVKYPGRIQVQKVDCTNHAVRGINSIIHKIKRNTQFALSDRKLIISQVNRFGKDVRAAISHNHQNQQNSENPTSAKTLYEDIVNIPAHVLGEHSRCKQYFCVDKDNDKAVNSNFSEFKNRPAGKELNAAFHRLANRSPRLIFNVTSNNAETFMSIVAKCISGKRVNYAQRGGYARRVTSAALSFNSGSFWPPVVFKSKRKTNPIWSNAAVYFEKSRRRGQTARQKSGPFKIPQKKSVLAPEAEYGVDCAQGALSETELVIPIDELVRSLQVDEEIQMQIEVSTRGQSLNPLWLREKKGRLSASNCGRVFRLKDWTSNVSTLKTLLYPCNLSTNENVKRGINLEPEAKDYYTMLTGNEVKECGVFVHLSKGFLAASPDGLIGEDGIMEIKCVNCNPEDIPKRPDNFLLRDSNGSLALRKTHKYYYQIIMQLYVCNKEFCEFFVFFKPKSDDEVLDSFIQTIKKDASTDELWSQMEEKLSKFYMLDMAPEIVDPQFPKLKKFRVPEYRQLAMDEHEGQKLAKKSS